MKIIEVVKPAHSRNGVKLYAIVESRYNPSEMRVVVYIRTSLMRRWLCDCYNQVFVCTGNRRNCAHIRAVRQKVGK